MNTLCKQTFLGSSYLAIYEKKKKKNADLLDTEVKGRVMSKSKQLKSVNTAFKSVSYHLEVQKLNITMTDCTVQSIQADSRKLGLISPN